MPTVIALTSQLPRDIEYTVPRRLSEDLYIMTTWNEHEVWEEHATREEHETWNEHQMSEDDQQGTR